MNRNNTNSFRCMTKWITSSVILIASLAYSINTAAATPVDSTGIAMSQSMQVAVAYSTSAVDGRKGKGKGQARNNSRNKSKGSRGASQRSPQRKKATSPKRSSPQRKKATSPKRSTPQRKKATSPKRSTPQRKKATSPKRSTPQRYRSPTKTKPRVSIPSRSPRVVRENANKSTAPSRNSRYSIRNQKSNNSNTKSTGRSRLVRTGNLYNDRSSSKGSSKISYWRKPSSKKESGYNEQYQQRRRWANSNANKNSSKSLSTRYRSFGSSGAADVFYDPPSSPVEKVIYDYEYNNQYNNTYYTYNNNNYYNTNNYYEHDYGFGHSYWRGWHHRSRFHHGSYRHSLRLWFNFHFYSGHGHHWLHYPHWSYSDYYYYEPYYPLHSYTTVYYEPAAQITYEPLLPSIDIAWELLADGAFEEALGIFAELVYALPFEGGPRIGYAIASGMLYRNGAAISAMRRAMIDDANALFEVPVEPRITEHYQWLLEHYSIRVREDSQDIDGLFMVAALRFILEEPTQAYFAIDLSIRRGDVDQSTENLKALISDVIEQGF